MYHTINQSTINPDNYKQKHSPLYKHLLQTNYLNDHIYHHQSNPNQIAQHSTQDPNNKPPQYHLQPKAQINMLKEKFYHSNWRRLSDPQSKSSSNFTQSLLSNYSITENENQSYSTINVQNLTRNMMEDHDLSLSKEVRQNISELEDYEEGESHSPQPSNELLPSIMNEEQAVIRKYKSLEYGMRQDDNKEDNEQQKIPKLLLKKLDSKKMSQRYEGINELLGNNHQKEQSFKTVLNQVHVVPYKINEEIKTYAYSLPLEAKEELEKRKEKEVRVNKAISLNLNHKRQLATENQEIQCIVPRHMYLSNHSHLQPKQHPQFTYYPPSHSELSKHRIAPKSEPKYHHVTPSCSNQKNTRSNSIECKNKPILTPNVKEDKIENGQDQLQSSRVTKLFKNEGQIEERPIVDIYKSSSIIFQSNSINFCCGDNTIANKINFLPKVPQNVPKQSCTNPISIDITNVTSYQKPKSSISKINPLKIIKNAQQEESERKKGIRLTRRQE